MIRNWFTNYGFFLCYTKNNTEINQLNLHPILPAYLKLNVAMFMVISAALF